MNRPPLVRVVLVAAVATNGVIGRDNALIWRLKSDLAHFKATTLGKPVVMGRKTFEGLGRPLPKRLNIVVSRQPGLSIRGVVVAPSWEAARAVALAEALRSGADRIAVIGGGDLYARTIFEADELLITHVDATPEGDTVFPAIEQAIWAGEEIARFPAGPDDDHAFAIVRYSRI